MRIGGGHCQLDELEVSVTHVKQLALSERGAVVSIVQLLEVK